MVTLLNISSLRSCVEKWNKRVHHNQDANYVLFLIFCSVALELRCMSNLWWLCGISKGAGGRRGSTGNIGLRFGQHISFPSSMWITLSPDSSEMERWLLFDAPPAWTQSCIHHPIWTHPKLCVCVTSPFSLLKDTDSECSDSLYVCVLGGEVDITVLFFCFSVNCNTF